MAFFIVSLAIISLLVFCLCLPLQISILLEIHEHFDLRIRFNWFFGWLSHKIEINNQKNREHKPVKKEVEGRLDWRSKLCDIFQIHGLRHRLWSLFKRLARNLKIKSIDADINYSLGDACYTGMCAGLLVPFLLLAERTFNGEIKIQPAFEEDLLFDGYLNSNLRIIPIAAIAPCLAFLCSPAAWHAGKIWMR